MTFPARTQFLGLAPRYDDNRREILMVQSSYLLATSANSYGSQIQSRKGADSAKSMVPIALEARPGTFALPSSIFNRDQATTIRYKRVQIPD